LTLHTGKTATDKQKRLADRRHLQDRHLVDLSFGDSDGDPLTVSVRVASSEASQLVDEFGLFGEAGDNDLGLNWSGTQQERWVRGDYDMWFFLLPDGSVNQWRGSFDDSVQVGSVSTAMYENPQLLLDAERPGVAAAIVEGQLQLTGAMETGTFQVTVEVTDQFTTTSTSFVVTLTNGAPELKLSDIDLAAGDTIVINLPTLDADGHTLSFEVAVIDPSLPQLDIDFVDQGSFYTNYLGNNERWLRDSDGQWYFILEDGNFYRWEDSFAASELIAELGTEYYAAPSPILDPPAPTVTATIENGVLTLIASVDFAGSVELRIRATDGIATVEQTVLVQSAIAAVSANAEGVDDVFANWGYLN
jgi:hypothetical protein